MRIRLSGLLFGGLLLLPLAAGAHEEASPPTGETLGTVHFTVSCNADAQERFTRAVAILHSFWYEEAEKAFKSAADADPNCAMAWWGVAMSEWHPLWYPPPPPALKAGAAAAEKAEAIGGKTDRERRYIGAIADFFRDSATRDYRTRALAYEHDMAELHARFPDDREAAVFYALALDTTALRTDKTFANQKKAAAILEPIFAEQPNHPGVAHYLIHSYDSPPLAADGLKAARRYAAIAPSVPHALHMPSHIFTRLGLWRESAETNRRSAEAGQAYAKKTWGDGVAWDQSLHGMDYLAYAYLQLGEDRQARALVDEVMGFKKVTPETSGAAYAMAAIPARYAVERRDWAAAAKLEPPPATANWTKFPATSAMITFARSLGDAHTGNLAGAKAEIEKLAAARDALAKANDKYWSDQVEVERRAAAATLAEAEGRHAEAIRELRAAADAEDAMDKAAVTPGAIVPTRELLADLLLARGQPGAALAEYKRVLATSPNRLRSLYGAAKAAAASGGTAEAKSYFRQLDRMAGKTGSARPEIAEATAYLAQ